MLFSYIKEILEDNFTPYKKVVHTHEGSIGNLCLKEINEKFERTLNEGKYLLFEVTAIYNNQILDFESLSLVNNSPVINKIQDKLYSGC